MRSASRRAPSCGRPCWASTSRRPPGLEAEERATTWWTSALRFLGCTGHAFETAVVFGDEIELRAESLQADASNPVEFLRLMVSRAGPGRSGAGRLASVLSLLAGGRKGAELNFRTACEVADVFAKRLGLDEPVRAALAANFERWNGRGLPTGCKGTAIPRPMRVAQLAQELEVLARIEGIAAGPRHGHQARRDKAYDPELADLVVAEGAGVVGGGRTGRLLGRGAGRGPSVRAARRRGGPRVAARARRLRRPQVALDERSLAGVAALALEACGPAAEAAALVHDLGCVAVPNSIWDKPGPLTRDERDRVETHALVTDQLLRRVRTRRPSPGRPAPRTSAATAPATTGASTAATSTRSQRVLAAADCYQAMTSDRPHRPALAPADAASELRAMSRDGRLDGEAVERVLAAAGHRRAARPPLPAGLTAREAEVLRLLSLGLTTREVADRLTISREDRRSPRAAHLHEDRRLDPRRRGAVRHRARHPRRRRVSGVPQPITRRSGWRAIRRART